MGAPTRLSLFLLLCAAAATSAARPPKPRRGGGYRSPVRPRPLVDAAVKTSFASPSSLWPLAAHVVTPQPTVNCTWGPVLTNQYVPGCAGGGYPCAAFPTLEQAQAACASDYDCGGVTSQDSGGPPWETRRGPNAVSSNQGEKSYLIANDCHGDGGGQCFPLPPDFVIVANASSYVNAVLANAMARYTLIINTAYATSTVLPPGAPALRALTVTVGGDEPLAFGMDESYALSVSAAGATLTAPTVWGALRGLETVSQLARHRWTTGGPGAAINASFNELCAVEVTDAPRFPFRGLMIDTSRHFMPVSVIKQVIELCAYLKLNGLRFHLIDETSWSYFVPALPNITNTSAFSPLHVYYPDDLRDLVAFGRARGVIVYPEIDFPSHSEGLLASLPLMGCLSADRTYRMYIDPLYPDLWPTMDKLFAVVNNIFPPEYPFHMGGDEVDRNEWATCPNAIAWANAHGHAGDVGNAVTKWWYTTMYNWLRAPPYNRIVMAWEDATDAVNATTWPGATTGGLILEQWNGSPGQWNSGTCDIIQAANASVLISGPFHDVIGTGPSYNSNPEQNYADMWNLTCVPLSARAKQLIVGPELMFWDDAADISASDMILMLLSSVLPVAESGWSPQSVVAPLVINPGRYQDMRCRLARRGMHSHDAYGHVGTFCALELDEALMPWSMLEELQ